MLKYTLQRIIYFIPTLLVISIIVFLLSKITPSDPVETYLNINAESSNTSISDELYQQTAHQLGLDKPVFYFTLTSKAFPKDLYTIIRKSERSSVENLIKKYGNYDKIALFHAAIKSLIRQLPDSSAVKNNLQQLILQDDDEKISFILNDITHHAPIESPLAKDIQGLKESYNIVKTQPQRSLLFIPTFYWYGFDNQYQNWLSHFLKGDWGMAKNGQNVLDKISRPLSITLIMSLLAIVFSYLIAVPLGVFTAANHNTVIGKTLVQGLFASYSIPSFWVALLALRFLTTPQYGMKIFPSAGLSDLQMSEAFFPFIMDNLGRLILPVLCMMIHPIAIIARHLQGAMLDDLSLDYTRTARAKGLNPIQVLRKHVFKNALFPLITLLGQLLPSLISGAFIVEYIFNIKGMGRTAFEAIDEQDWNVVYSILMLSAIMILIGNLIADGLYKWANPRIVINE